MEERILEILKTLVAMKSVSCSTVEVEPAEWFAGFFKTLPYFEKHPEDTGLYEIPGDPYGRKIPYAFLKGIAQRPLRCGVHRRIWKGRALGIRSRYFQA